MGRRERFGRVRAVALMKLRTGLAVNAKACARINGNGWMVSVATVIAMS